MCYHKSVSTVSIQCLAREWEEGSKFWKAVTQHAVFCPGFQKGRVPSEKGTLARWTDRQKGTLARWTDRQKGTLARWTEEKGHN